MSLLFEPRDINLGSLLRQKYSKSFLAKHKWKYYHFYTLLLKKHLYRKKKSRHGNWYPVSSSALRALYGCNGQRGSVQRVHRIIREDFKHWGIVLHHTEQVAENQRVSRYKLLDERILAGFCLADIVTPHRHITPKPAPAKYTGVQGLLQQAAGKLRVDYEAASIFIEDSYANSLPLKDKPIVWEDLNIGNWAPFRNRVVDASVYSRWLWHLYKLDRGSYGFKVDTGNTNRIFYLLTQIPSHLRQFILRTYALGGILK